MTPAAKQQGQVLAPCLCRLPDGLRMFACVHVLMLSCHAALFFLPYAVSDEGATPWQRRVLGSFPTPGMLQ